jgi:hypothetical protein
MLSARKSFENVDQISAYSMSDHPAKAISGFKAGSFSILKVSHQLNAVCQNETVVRIFILNR